MAGNIPRWLDDRTRVDSTNGNTRQERCEEEEVFGTNNSLKENIYKTMFKKRDIHTTLYSVVSKFFKRLVAAQPLPSTTMVFFSESNGS
jgi:hypothetical protein